MKFYWTNTVRKNCFQRDQLWTDCCETSYL